MKAKDFYSNQYQIEKKDLEAYIYLNKKKN